MGEGMATYGMNSLSGETQQCSWCSEATAEAWELFGPGFQSLFFCFSNMLIYSRTEDAFT